MGELDKGGTVTLQELLVTSLAQTDAVAKLTKKLKAERAGYREMLRWRV